MHVHKQVDMGILFDYTNIARTVTTLNDNCLPSYGSTHIKHISGGPFIWQLLICLVQLNKMLKLVPSSFNLQLGIANM